MKSGDKAYWKHLRVAVLGMAGANAVIKSIGSQGRGNVYTVPFTELRPDVPVITKLNPHALDCPDCGLSYPSYRSGVECPGCHFKESLSFRKWLL